ncbi:hypothetical protein Q3G72_033559 [Acer saccharum]|nr:hypothetical protein Q3G72_033559 [Acer saccharum]
MEHKELYSGLNMQQMNVHDIVVQSLIEKKKGLYFVYGAGGTGKTYLYKTTLSRLRLEGKICLAVVSSGIASLLLPGGRTAHSRGDNNISHSDSICKASRKVFDQDMMFPVEFLNSLKFPGLPNHELHLKIGIPLILLRNINPSADEGKVYSIQNFKVVDNNGNYKPVSHQYKLLLLPTTTINELKGDHSSIPVHQFEFQDFENLERRVDDNTLLTGNICLSITDASKVYINIDIPEVSNLMKR